MADAVSTDVVISGPRRRVITLTNVSDGTGESGVVKVDRSALTGPDGTAPTRLVVEKIEYAIDGMQVRLYYQHTAGGNLPIAILSGAGYFDWTDAGGRVDSDATADEGDIILTTNAHTAGDGYTITMWVRLKD